MSEGLLLYGANKPNLDARLVGFNGGVLMAAPANAKTKFYHQFTFSCLVNGIDFYAHEATKGDCISMNTEYFDLISMSWVRYKKFGKCWGVVKALKERIVLFPTTPGNGVRMVVEYDNKSLAAPAEFIINLFQFFEAEVVDTANGQEGTNW